MSTICVLLPQLRTTEPIYRIREYLSRIWWYFRSTIREGGMVIPQTVNLSKQPAVTVHG